MKILILICFVSISSLAFSKPGFALQKKVIDPVKIVSFAADYEPEKRTINIHWATEDERNGVKYLIERSLDSVHFMIISQIESRVNKGYEQQEYFFLDEKVIGGTLYYRIRQIDEDNSQYITPVVKVKQPISGLEIAQLMLSRDQSQLNFSIVSPDSTKSSIFVTNLNGDMIASFIIGLKRGINQHSIYIGDQPNGVYFFQVNDLTGGETRTKRVIKGKMKEEKKDHLSPEIR